MTGGGRRRAGYACAPGRTTSRLVLIVIFLAVGTALPNLASGRSTITVPRGTLIQLPGSRGCLSERRVDGCKKARALAGAASVAVSPDGRNVYVASNGSSAVVVFARDARTGALTQLAGKGGCTGETDRDGCAVGRGLTGAFSVAVSPDGRNVYVVGDEAVAVFARDPKDGALAQLPGSAACVSIGGAGGCGSANGLYGGASVTVSPDGANVYVASVNSNAVAVFARNPATGAISQLPGQAGCVSESGAGGCQYGRALDGAFSVAVSPDGKDVYAAALSSNAIVRFQRDPVDGELSEAPDPSACTSEGGSEDCATGRGITGPNAVAVVPNGQDVYSAASGGSAVAAFLRGQSAGTLDQLRGGGDCTSEGGADGCSAGRGLSGAYALAISPEGTNVYVAALDSIAAFSRSSATGRLSELAGQRGCFDEHAQDHCPRGRGLAGASSIAVSPDGRTVYVASLQSDAVSVFARTPTPDRLKLRVTGVPRRCVSKPFTVHVAVTSTLALRSVTLELDRRSLAHTTRHIVRRRIQAQRLSLGGHTLRASATDAGGHTVSRLVRFARCG